MRNSDVSARIIDTCLLVAVVVVGLLWMPI